MCTDDGSFPIIDNGGRHLNPGRRRYSNLYHFPERRTSNGDRRINGERRMSQDRGLIIDLERRSDNKN